jgi:benzoate membrane transport protein
MPKLFSSRFEGFFSDLSASAIIAGITAIIVGYAGPTVIIFQVAENANLTDGQIASWLWAYSIGSAIITIYASWTTRQPQIMAWSTPGVAFLVFALTGYQFSDAIAAFLISNLIILLIGYLAWFQKVMAMVPMSVAAALNAGILLPFAVQGIDGWKMEPEIVGSMVATFFIVRFFSPRWAVAAVLLVGGVVCVAMGKAQMDQFEFVLATPIFTMPTFDLGAVFDIAVPLTVLALTGQYLPGLAVLKSYGYQPDNNRVVKQCGFISLLFAPFGCHNLNPSSMIAGIVAGPEANEDPSKRYWAAIVAGVVYIIFGTLATSFVLLFSSLPAEAIMALAGISLLAAIAHSLNAAMKEEVNDILTPTVVFIVAISNIEIFSIGSIFWAIIVGLALSLVERLKEKK